MRYNIKYFTNEADRSEPYLVNVEIDENRRQEFESHNILSNGVDICIWVGQMRGSYYMNFSYRIGDNLIEISRMAHITKEVFIDILGKYPLDWRLIIDCVLVSTTNIAPWGWDFKNHCWKGESNSIDFLSSR